MNHTYCRSCKAPIVWVLTNNGKHMPIDLTPVGTGNIVLNGITAEVLKAGVVPPQGVPRYVSHFSTCPDSDQHRKAK